jgi:4-hydroxy-tetrahydrodipicolinate reductase
MMAALPVALAGATGRMGQAVIAAIERAPDLTLVAALCASDDPKWGTPCSPGHRVLLSDDVDASLAQCQVLIDFTTPDASHAMLLACSRAGKPMVIGTTGFSAAQRQQILEAARELAIVLAPNLSVGVNLSLALLALAARTLPADYDVEIVEMHHRNKVDAPSGTALKMGEVIAHARGSTLEALRMPPNHGHTGTRPRGTIGFAALRGGDVIGEHTAVFLGEGERIEVTHRSSSRTAYADGSLIAARFVMKAKAGLYDMRDVLGLNQL